MMEVRASLGRSVQLLVHLDEHKKMGDRDADGVRADAEIAIHLIALVRTGEVADDNETGV